jgi:hypothetical protein
MASGAYKALGCREYAHRYLGGFSNSTGASTSPTWSLGSLSTDDGVRLHLDATFGMLGLLSSQETVCNCGHHDFLNP